MDQVKIVQLRQKLVRIIDFVLLLNFVGGFVYASIPLGNARGLALLSVLVTCFLTTCVLWVDRFSVAVMFSAFMMLTLGGLLGIAFSVGFDSATPAMIAWPIWVLILIGCFKHIRNFLRQPIA